MARCKEACKDNYNHAFKGWFITANVFVLLFGLAMLGVGVWLKYDYGAFARFDSQSAFNYMLAINLLISAGVFTTIFTAMALYRSFKGRPSCSGPVLAYGCIVLTLMILLITLGIFANKYKKEVEENAHSAFNKTLDEEYGRSDDKVKLMADRFMERYSCCGTNGYKDWQTSYFSQGSHTIVPDSCCETVKDGCGKNFTISEINQKGCWEDFLDVATMNYRIVNGVSTGFGLAMINAILAAFCLAYRLKKGQGPTSCQEIGNLPTA